MFFIISKILSFFLEPFSWIFVLLLIAVLTKKELLKKRLVLSTLILFLFFGNSLISDLIIKTIEVPLISQKEMPVYDIGIVLSGGMATFDKLNDRITFHANTDRILQAIDLYKKGKIKKIALVGGSGSLVFRDMKESEILHKFLRTIEIPEKDIIIENESDNTRENALFFKKIIDKRKIKGSFLIITSSTHISRSVACFKKVGINADYYSTNIITGKIRHDFGYLLIPSMSGFNKWRTFIHETLGYSIYWIMGYV